MLVKPERPLCHVQRRVRIRIISLGFRTTREFATALAKVDSEYQPYHRDYWWRGLSMKSKMNQLLKASELLDTNFEQLIGSDTGAVGNDALIKELRVNLNE